MTFRRRGLRADSRSRRAEREPRHRWRGVGVGGARERDRRGLPSERWRPTPRLRRRAAATPVRSRRARGRGCARTSPGPSTRCLPPRPRAGHALTINSAFRSDAEQAALFAANPDPRMVARPGTSLHRCGTELDLGPPSAYGWFAANAQRFGFVQRYAWEAWHYGYVRGPAPCSSSGDRIAAGRESDGASSQVGLPSFVPARFRAPLALASSRWNVPANVLAAQLLAESNFNPLAVSPAGASGIAQFMPGTAAAYGLPTPSTRTVRSTPRPT